MKDALSNDRARIQVGRISHFGLLEMSRQRIRTGVLEGSTVPCPHCAGVGMVRSKSSIALHVMRVLEDALLKNASYHLTVRTRTEVALYILNQKRTHLRDLETRFGVTITVAADETLTGAIYHAVERGEQILLADGQPRPEMVRIDSIAPAEIEEFEEEAEIVAEEEEAAAPARPHPARQQERPRERGHDREQREPREPRQPAAERPQRDAARSEEQPTGEHPGDESEQSRRRRRRRRRRGGSERENVQNFAPGAAQPQDDGLEILAHANGDMIVSVAQGELPAVDSSHADAQGSEMPVPTAGAEPAEAPRRSRRGRTKAVVAEAVPAMAEAVPAEVAAPVEGEEAARPAKRPRRAPRAKAAAVEEAVVAPVSEPVVVREAAAEAIPVVAAVPELAAAATPAPRAEPLPEAEAGPKRSGWWQRVKNATIGN